MEYQRIVLLPILAYFTACATPNLYSGITNVKAQDGQSLSTTQKCIRSKEAIKIADVALVVTLRVMYKAGYIDDYFKAISESRHKPQVCLIELPEPCRFAGWTLSSGARKRGCSSSHHAWTALYWPPICKAEWPSEPNCTTDANLVSTMGWEETLIHEIFNYAVLRWSNVKKQSYEHEIYKLENKVQAWVRSL